jgi:hypothetical protein
MKQTDAFDWVGRLGAGASQPDHVGECPSGDGFRGTVEHGRLGGVYDSIASMTEGLAALPLVPFNDGELWDAAAELARLQRAAELGLVRLVAELAERGLECPGGLSRVDWLRSHHPGLAAAHAKAITVVGQASLEPRWHALTALVYSGGVTVPAAAQVIGFYERIHRLADPDELDLALDDLVTKAQALAPEQLAKWVRHHTETVAPPKDIEHLDAAKRASRGLWFGRPSATDMVTGRLVLDPEGAAIVQAAIDPLAAPRPGVGPDGTDGTESRDPRSPATRRADALLEVVARGVASPGAAPSTDRAKVVVTVDLTVLEERVRGCGHAQTGQVLSAATVRRMACDAEVVPAVLGTAPAPLDVGRSHRLVPPAIRHAAWMRDGGCTYPGCTIPPAWTDAHHVTHWADGGSTSLENTALLCGRHHTVVHQQGLTATVTHHGVTWHT